MSQIFRDEAEIFRILQRLLYFYLKNYAINSATAVVSKCNKRDEKTPDDVCSDEQKPIADGDPSHCVPLLRWRGRLGDQENSLRRLVGGAHKRDEPEKEKSRNCCGAAVHRSCSSRAST